MKPGAGKGKGASFEIVVCKRLSLWISNGQSDDLLWRSAMSGGRATLQFKTVTRREVSLSSTQSERKVNITQSGDVSAIGQGAYEFCECTFVEIKHYKELNIARGFVCNTGNLARFWNKARVEAEKYGKRPLLIARQNLYPTLAISAMKDSIFKIPPLLTAPRWGAYVHLFDEATRVVVRRVRRAS